MLSEYFAYLWISGLVAVLYAVVRLRKWTSAVLLWLPTAAFLLVSIPGHLCLSFVRDPFSPVYLFHALFVEPWESNFITKLVFCLGLSLLAWLLCRRAQSKASSPGKAFGGLAVFFLICAMIAGLCRNFNIPYRFMVENDGNYLKKDMEYPYYRHVDYGIAGGIELHPGMTSRAMEIHEAPTRDSPIIAAIPAGEGFNPVYLDFTYATTEKGWRYINLSSGDFEGDYAGVCGYVQTEELIQALARGQGRLMYDCFARYKLFCPDQVAFEAGAYVTDDYSQTYAPMGLYMAVVLFVVFAALWVVKWCKSPTDIFDQG